jgi:hypothetical protein
MSVNKKVEDLLSQPMNRRQFLRNVGLLIISIIGVSNALHILAGRQHTARPPDGKHGFGSGKFGV